MRHPHLIGSLFLLTLLFTLSPNGRAQEDAAPGIDLDAEIGKLAENAASFIAAFNGRDAETLAGLFLPAGEIVLASGEVIATQEEILAHYTEVFSDEGQPEAAVDAGSVRFVAEDLAMEDGTFHLTYDTGEVSSHEYIAVHSRQEDGSWLIASLKDIAGDNSLPDEKLPALSWLIGDWLIEYEGSDTWISFDWSQSGPYIDARALTEAAGETGTMATMRIGCGKW